jgi:tetratricopeptide (TPR) repeat protein
MLAGYIDRRRGRWDNATGEFEKAADLDPRTLNAVNFLGDHYRQLRRFDQARRWWLKQARQFAPHARLFEAFAEWMDFSATGQTTKFRVALHPPARNQSAAAITSVRVLIEADGARLFRGPACSHRVAAFRIQDIGYVLLSARWYEAQIARAEAMN